MAEAEDGPPAGSWLHSAQIHHGDVGLGDAKLQVYKLKLKRMPSTKKQQGVYVQRVTKWKPQETYKATFENHKKQADTKKTARNLQNQGKPLDNWKLKYKAPKSSGFQIPHDSLEEFR